MQTSNESNISNSQDLQKSSLQSEGELIEQYFSQFQKACISGDLDSVKEVIATSIMPLDYYTIGLHTAASNNHSKLVRYLVEHGGADIENINKRGLSPLGSAVISCSYSAGMTLIELGANVDVDIKVDNCRSLLHVLVEQKNVDLPFLEALLSRTHNINCQNKFGETALYLAAYRPDIVKLLLQYNADVNILDKYGSTPLFSAIASKYCNLESVKLLIEHGVNCHIGDAGEPGSCKTLIHIAIIQECTPVLIELLQHCRDLIESFDEYGCTPLMMARTIETMEVLLAHGANPDPMDKDGHTLLVTKCFQANMAAVNLLLRYGADVDVMSQFPYRKDKLLLLCRLSLETEPTNVTLFEALVAHSKKLNIVHESTGCTYLGFCYCKPEYVRILLKYEANPNIPDKNGTTPILRALSNKCYESVKILLDHGAHVNESTLPNGDSCLHILMCKPKTIDYDLLNRFLAAKADLSASNKKGQSVLAVALDSYHSACVILMLESILKWKNLYCTEDVQRCWQYGYYYKDKRILSLCLSIGVDVNHVFEDGYTVLHAACSLGEVSMVEILLQHPTFSQASIHFLKRETCDTPLHLAAISNHPEIIKMLVTVGKATLEISNTKKYTPLQSAFMSNAKEAIDMLISLGAKADGLKNGAITPLLHALLRAGRYELVKLALANMTNFDEINSKTTGTSLLHAAASRNQADLCKILLQNGMNVDNADTRKNTALHLAVEKDFIETVTVLLEYKANASLLNESRKTALHVAVPIASFQVLEILLKNSSSCIDEIDMSFKTVLHYAIKRADIGIIKLLLRHKADPSVTKENPALFDAFASPRYQELIPVILEQYPNCLSTILTSQQETLLLWTIEKYAEHETERLKFVLSLSPPESLNAKDMCGRTPLSVAVKSNKTLWVKELLISKCEVDWIDEGILSNAIQNQNMEVLKALIERCGNEFKFHRKFTLLNKVASLGNIEMLQYLLSFPSFYSQLNHMDPKFPHHTPLFTAVNQMNFPMIQLLHETYQAPLVTSFETALHVAARTDYIDVKVLEYLISKGVNVNAINKHKETALGIVAEHHMFDIAEWLLEHGADVNTRIGPHKSTPLHKAVEGGNVKFVRYLIQRKAALEWKQYPRHTPLMLAVMNGDRPNFPQEDNLLITKALIDAGANLFTRNQHRCTLLSVAEASNNSMMIETIREGIQKRREEGVSNQCSVV